MLNGPSSKPTKILWRKYVVALAGWILLLGGSALRNIQESHQETINTAIAAARSSISKDIEFREWVASHGGVYVKPSEQTPPNPYLNLPDRDVVTTGGMALTLMNPAYALRELQKHSHAATTQTHITSLKPLNPDNSPDPWEVDALNRFQQDSKEVVALLDGEAPARVRVMRPFVVEANCLKCHQQQGYKVGDIRGGISTTVSLSPYLADERERNGTIAWSHGLICLFGLLGMLAVGRREKILLTQRMRADEALRQREADLSQSLTKARRFADVLDNSPSHIYMKDANGKYLYGNKMTLSLFQCSAKELVGKGDENFFPAAAVAKLKEVDARVLLHGEITREEIDVAPETPERRIYWEVKHPMRDEAGRIIGLCGISTDVTEKQVTEEKLARSEALFHNYFELAQIGMAISSADRKWLIANQRLCLILGYSRDELAQRPWAGLIHPDDRDAGRRENEKLVAGEIENYSIEIRFIHKNGSIIFTHMTVACQRHPNRSVDYFIASIEDITAQKVAEETIKAMALFDTLTKLPNRRMLEDRLGQAFAASKRSGLYGALMFLDLDNFKPLNDEWGHPTGDLLLIEVAHRLTRGVRGMDTVARFGGDEFIVLAGELDADLEEATQQAEVIARKIRDLIAEPYFLKQDQGDSAAAPIEHHCTSSIGVVMFIGDQASADDIIKWADRSMYQAKETGPNLIRFYAATAE